MHIVPCGLPSLKEMRRSSTLKSSFPPKKLCPMASYWKLQGSLMELNIHPPNTATGTSGVFACSRLSSSMWTWTKTDRGHFASGLQIFAVSKAWLVAGSLASVQTLWSNWHRLFCSSSCPFCSEQVLPQSYCFPSSSTHSCWHCLTL